MEDRNTSWGCNWVSAHGKAWKGWYQDISNTLVFQQYEAIFVDIRQFFSMFNYIKNPSYTLRSQIEREALCEGPRLKSAHGLVVALDLPSTRGSVVRMEQKAQNLDFLCAVELLDSSVGWSACRKAQGLLGGVGHLQPGVWCFHQFHLCKPWKSFFFKFYLLKKPQNSVSEDIRVEGVCMALNFQLPRASECKEISANPEAEFYL